jgi:hypothetical protein
MMTPEAIAHDGAVSTIHAQRSPIRRSRLVIARWHRDLETYNSIIMMAFLNSLILMMMEVAAVRGREEDVEGG